MSDSEHDTDDGVESLGVAATDPQGGIDEVTTSRVGPPEAPSTLVSLKSLAPSYNEAQHQTYLQRLEGAITDPKNLNIALTGRYGTGKSSVLEEFERNHSSSTLRLAISTLGPEPVEESQSNRTHAKSLTNRIQKELVKQLVYSASAGTLRYSRFKRIKPTSLKVAAGESAVAVAVVAALLVLLGWLPQAAWTGGGQPWFLQVGVWVAVFALVVAVATAVRQVTVNRFFLSNFSAAGASVTLSERTPTYFDEYLDVIVRYFDEESKDIVILEDLDRFNDPHIFEALRELNTLLNNTETRRERKTPLRFVYAMRDSLFEKLGADTKEQDDDAGVAETVRANRTKFFDIVIPLVPFISHRNARELLTQILGEAGIDDIDRRLIELVAQHASDMRLLLNMRNEYLVFAERLLRTPRPAPGLTPSNLFALVAYKNFHLADFEQISRRCSDLDVIYARRRHLVRTCVAQREKRMRALAQASARPHSMEPYAKLIGDRLHAVSKVGLDRMNGWQDYQIRFIVDGSRYDPEQATKPDFWEEVVAAGSVTLAATPNPKSNPPQSFGVLERERLEDLFPEALKGRWEERNEAAAREESRKLGSEVDFLRGADFRDLAKHPEFTTPVDGHEVTFAELLDTTLKSGLARDLVKHGYIDRNFTLYAAQFYGNFTGVDVATFIVQTVEANAMDIDYRFTSDGAVPNLLKEAPDEFTRTVSAYNIQLLDFLLESGDDRATDVVNHVASSLDDRAREFLAAYLTSGTNRRQLVARLSGWGWRDVFTYLVTDEGVPADARVGLVDAALLAAESTGAYDVGPDFADFVVEHYKDMSVFTAAHEEAALRTVVSLLERAEVALPDLDGVHDQLRNLASEHDLYQLTAANLRFALGITGAVNLDRVRQVDTVYRYCLANLSKYLEAVESDNETQLSVETPGTLADVLSSAAAEDWDEGLIQELTASASPDSALPRLAAAPERFWPALAAARLFDASLTNLEAYRTHVGAIDESLCAVLLSVDVISTSVLDADEGQEAEQPNMAAAAVAILNAGPAILPPVHRVQLVWSLGLTAPLTATQIAPEESNLFALLLENGLVPDDAATFAQLRGGGWAAVEPAITASNKVSEFLNPVLVDGMVAEIFETPAIADKVGTLVLEDLAAFVPTDEPDTLASAAKFAIRKETQLPLEQIRRVAMNCKDAPDLTFELLRLASPSVTQASEIVEVLALLGTPYNHLSSRDESKFEVPDGNAYKDVFTVLRDAELCTVRKKPNHSRLIVELRKAAS